MVEYDKEPRIFHRSLAIIFKRLLWRMIINMTCEMH